jgi:hypothetical protein
MMRMKNKREEDIEFLPGVGGLEDSDTQLDATPCMTVLSWLCCLFGYWFYSFVFFLYHVTPRQS